MLLIRAWSLLFDREDFVKTQEAGSNFLITATYFHARHLFSLGGN